MVMYFVELLCTLLNAYALWQVAFGPAEEGWAPGAKKVNLCFVLQWVAMWCSVVQCVAMCLM